MLREPNSTNNFAKNHFFSLLLFRSDNAIFHNKDNISIFYKMLKICKICGYWVVYNCWCFERLKKAIKIPFFSCFWRNFSYFLCYIYLCPISRNYFVTFGGEFCVWCAGKHKYLKIYGDDRIAETSHYRKWKAIFPLYYHTRSLASKTKSNRERIAFPITIFCYFPFQHVDVADS